MGSWDVEIVAFVVSPGHNYWFHSRDPAVGVGPHPTSYPHTIDLVADQGIVGDRFFGKVSQLASAVSFIAVEAVDAVGADLDPRLARRNVVVRGVDLNGLRGRDFSLDSGAGPVSFTAGGETSPCAWMDAVFGAGARQLLRGRGGLRASPTSDGRLRLGSVILTTDADLDPRLAGSALRRSAPLP